MRLTRGGEYGIRGMLYLAMQPGSSVTLLSEISSGQNIPESYLAKIFQALAKAGLVRSHRGFKGGYSLGRAANEISVKDIIEAIEGPIALNHCSTEEANCAEILDCKIQDVWRDAQSAMVGVLRATTLADLVEKSMAAQT